MTIDTANTRWTVPAFLLMAGFVLLAYGPCLDNCFWEIDDPRHVANGAGFPFPNRYFRPGQELSVRLLWMIGGTNPLSYYLTGLACHLAATLLEFLLALRLLAGRLAAAVAASTRDSSKSGVSARMTAKTGTAPRTTRALAAERFHWCFSIARSPWALSIST